jgi:hypothetical protein
MSSGFLPSLQKVKVQKRQDGWERVKREDWSPTEWTAPLRMVKQ